MQPKAIAHLLFKEVKELPEKEQTRVLEYFFEQAIGPARPSNVERSFRRPSGAGSAPSLFRPSSPHSGPRQPSR
jgi:hypothetical protein